jgi:hypothetical protein
VNTAAGAKSEDMIFVSEQTNEVLTEMPDWSTIEKSVAKK